MMAPSCARETDKDIFETAKLVVHSLMKPWSVHEFGTGQVAGNLDAKSSGWNSRLRSEMLDRTLFINLDVENLPWLKGVWQLPLGVCYQLGPFFSSWRL